MTSSNSTLRFPSGASVKTLKKDARKLARAKGITNTEALNQLAREHGIDLPWDKAVKTIDSKPPARITPVIDAGSDRREIVTPIEIKKSHQLVFHAVSIGPLEFRGIVSADGPYITCKKANYLQGGVAIGPASIVSIQDKTAEQKLSYRQNVDRDVERTGAAYWIVKYSAEIRVDLVSLTHDMVTALSQEFGLPISETGYGDEDYGKSFLQSPAFDGLKAWCRRHPRKAREMGKNGNSYIADWYAHAISPLTN